MDVLTLLIGAVFYVLFAASIRRYLRHRATLELAVVLVFTSTAAIFALTIVNRFVPALQPAVSPLAVIMLMAQPPLMLRLVGLVVRLPVWAVPAAFIGFVSVLVAYYGTGRSSAATIALVAYFAITEIVAAAILITEGQRRRGSPRIRLTTAGGASVLFGASIVISGAAAVARGPDGVTDPTITLVSRVVALVAAVGYLVAFVPPRWLRELGHRALAFELVRSVVSSPTGTDSGVLWAALAGAAGRILGTEHLAIREGDRIVAGGTVRDVLPGERRTSVSIPLTTVAGNQATLEAVLDERPLFLEDDVALIGLLGSLTGRAVERERIVARLVDASRALVEAEAVKASEARFRTLLDADPNAILSVDESGVIGWCTRTAATLFGVADDWLVGRRLDEIITSPPTTAPMSGGSGVRRYETIAHRADGRSFPAEVATSSFDFGGEPHTLVVVADIAWRRDADALRDRFIDVLSHELRTPITSIFGGTQLLLLRDGRLDDATKNGLLVDVAAEAERLERMVENLLILARVERGAEVGDLAPTLIHRVIPDALAREQRTWPAMTIRTDISPDLPVVAADHESVSLVLSNLVANAGKYAGPDATVWVTARSAPDGTVSITVRDDGPGIAPEDSESLFDLYFRSARHASAPGSGIGLFVCRQLVSAMGGRIWVHSGAAGGAEFGFTVQAWTGDQPNRDELERVPIVLQGTAPASSRSAWPAAGRTER